MQRRKFSREYKIEAVRLVRDRGGSVAQASRDLDVHENVLRKWAKEFGSDPRQAFPGHGNRSPSSSKSTVRGARSRSSRRSVTS
jgi:transposase